ncbi:FG-GAP-like repeat-containing protein [Thalassotalea sp. Y01]|uniref:FG-GAP-like repeat-containing protein n=1 Tax=Thalassotalea sp. Y01 TaxID=2729613 RepID=UPI00145EB435|nr:hypothetical protein [Thalassotalea sp. Y01]
MPTEITYELDEYQYTPQLSVESNQVSFSIANKPEWLVFDSDNGRLTGTPSQTDSGSYEGITLTAYYDAQTASQTFSIDVYDSLSISGSLQGFEHLNVDDLSTFIDSNNNGVFDPQEPVSEINNGLFEWRLKQPSLAQLRYVQPVIMFSGDQVSYLQSKQLADLAGELPSLPIAIENSDINLEHLVLTPLHVVMAAKTESYRQKLYVEEIDIAIFEQQAQAIGQYWGSLYSLPLQNLLTKFEQYSASLSLQQKGIYERITEQFLTNSLLLQSAQIDSDNDGVVNSEDNDVDNDGFINIVDTFPVNALEHADNDFDGLGDAADDDDDNDQVIDVEDAFPFDVNEFQDNDSDGIGDVKDTDDDNDGINDEQDHFPLDRNEYLDTDLDGIGNNADADDDGDGVLDINDDFPLDKSRWQSDDADLDGWPVGQDPDDSDNRVPELLFVDSDHDGFADNGGLAPDMDDDNDGVQDIYDDFPLDKTEYIDTDGDGIGNNKDDDDDNDLVADIHDAFPLDASESKDNDGDGIGDNADKDDDNDGIPDEEDDIDDIHFDADALNSGLIFSESTNLLGLSHKWAIDSVEAVNATQTVAYNVAGGLASADYDQDGDIDIFVVGGNEQSSKLYQKQNDGSYKDVAASAGVQLTGLYSGPAFADIDGDGDLDLFVAALPGFENTLFINEGNGKFHRREAGLVSEKSFNISSSFGDFDGDGYLDLLLTHYGETLQSSPQLLWKNQGDKQFMSVDDELNVTEVVSNQQRSEQSEDYMFTASFADINQDGWQDIVIAADHSTSAALMNQQGKHFNNGSSDLNIRIDDLQGMGSSLADIDNDGDLDWFITSITQFDADNGSLSFSGNKLLENNGDGSFRDISYASNSFNGGWAWASCAADFNNDGWIDLLNVNGWLIESDSTNQYESHLDDTIALFINNQQGKFSRTNINVGLTHKGQGRAVLCTDFDGDGDTDILLTDHTVGKNALVYYENQNGNQLGNYITIVLSSAGKNSQGVGAMVEIQTRNGKQYRHINLNSNFTSQSPARAMFGVGQNRQIDHIQVTWPDGSIQHVENMPVNQSILIKKSDSNL